MKMKLGWSTARTAETLDHIMLSSAIDNKQERCFISFLHCYRVVRHVLADLARLVGLIPAVDAQG